MPHPIVRADSGGVQSLARVAAIAAVVACVAALTRIVVSVIRSAEREAEREAELDDWASFRGVLDDGVVPDPIRVAQGSRRSQNSLVAPVYRP